MNHSKSTQPIAQPSLSLLRAARLGGAVLLATLTPCAFAHPGHAFLDQGPAHWVSSPDHALMLLAASIVLGVLGRLTPRPLTRRLAYAGSAVTLMMGLTVFGILGS